MHYLHIMLITLCASHLNNISRVNRLRQLIISMQEQLKISPTDISFIISISYKGNIIDVIKRMIEQNISPEEQYITIRYRHKQMTQFEHYKMLHDELIQNNISSEQIISFMDDDDILHPLHQHAVIRAMTECADNTIMHINALVRYQCKDMTQYNNISYSAILQDTNKIPDKSDFPEYFMYIMRISVLTEFLNNCAIELLRDKYCDMCFGKYLRSHINIKICTFNTWLYCKIDVIKTFNISEYDRSICTNFKEQYGKYNDVPINDIYSIYQKARIVSTANFIDKSFFIQNVTNLYQMKCSLYYIHKIYIDTLISDICNYLLNIGVFNLLINSYIHKSNNAV